MKTLFTALLLTILCTIAQAQSSYKRYTNLPTIYIETFDGRGISSKTIEKYARLIYIDEQDSVTEYDSVLVRGRGNSTWNLSKKPYRIKFNEKQKFLGTGYAKAKKWTLLANAGDKSLIRNAVTSSMGEFLGMKFNPAYKFCDLVINGTFLGNYQISDQVEVRPHRVNITEQDDLISSESDITGGYLLEVDGFADGNAFYTSRYSVPIRIHYPDEDDIVTAQNQYIRQYMRDFETTLNSSTFDDPDKGYRRWVDSVSLANWLIATEVSANIDGYYSTYFYKDQGDSLLYWGPLWDYDIAYNNDQRITGTERKLMTNDGYGETKKWINRMWKDPWFCQLINRRYAEALESGMVDHMIHTIDSLERLLNESQNANYRKWGINTKVYHEIVLYSSYSQYLRDLRTFIKTHTDYLTTAFASKVPNRPVQSFVPGNYYYKIINYGNSKALDLAGTGVCLWDNVADRQSQQWIITKVDGNYHIKNRESGKGLNDPTSGSSTATTNVGTQLNVITSIEASKRQQWQLTYQETKDSYNLTNVYTDHTANVQNGSSANGTPVISYTTDSKNETSGNRLWYIVQEDPIVDEEIDELESVGIADIPADEPEEYALAYNPQTQTLHFGSATPEMLTFTVNIHNLSGIRVGTFVANEHYSTAHLPRATYVITWKCGGKQRSAKVAL